MSDKLIHYGTPRKSGRYDWGSGDNGYQRAIGWRGHVRKLKNQGFTELDIAKAEGISINQLRARTAITKSEIRAVNTAEAVRMLDRGYSKMEIARRMSTPEKTWNESSIRSLLDPVLSERSAIIKTTANVLKEGVDQKRFIDIGTGVETNIGVHRTKLNTAVASLEDEGYQVHKINVPQVGMPGKFTIMKVLGAPGTTWKELVNDPSQIKNLDMISKDYGKTFEKSSLGLKPIQHVSSTRVAVKYAEDGGTLKDGVIELRRGVNDLDLGNSKYAQVRIGVDGTHYLKGMAIYNDKMPDGVDIIFNSNKHDTGNKLDAMKKLKDDPDNPFGSTIKQNGQKGALNVVNEEGDWETWSKTLSSQILSKQPVPLAKKQLELGYQQKKEEYDDIMNLTNPVVKKQLLTEFSDSCDSSSVHLKAAGLPRQASKVILPVPDLKENEVYAPTFRPGEQVVLIRHPHGGTFEIPQLTVNNKSKSAQAIMKNSRDAVGINPKVAEKLSGADFDGDTVIVIPNNSGLIKTSASLKGLEKFNPSESYPPYDGMKTIDGGIWSSKTNSVDFRGVKPKTTTKGAKMGGVSNLITDMTIKGANLDEVARAVRHSMVVIDSEKHHLNYKQSYIDNDIAGLSAKYQNSSRGGASTIISKASSDSRPFERKEGAYVGPISKKTGKATLLYIDPATGKKLYRNTGESYEKRVKVIDPATGKVMVDPSTGKPVYRATGKIINKTSRSTKMADTDDARTLSSGRQIEEVYASHANKLKALGNLARKNTLEIESTPYNPSAKKTYQQEVYSLEAKLNVAYRNKPLERQAQVVANSVLTRKKQANPDMDDDEIKKVKNASLAEARVRLGASKNLVDISDREWEAIQAGAISSSRLSAIIQNANPDRIKQLATPRTNVATMSPAKLQRAQSLLEAGLTQADVADALGVSTSLLSKALNPPASN